MDNEDDIFDDLNQQSLEMYAKHYGTPLQRIAKRAERKAQRKELLAQYPHLECYSMTEEESDAAAIFWDEHECKYRGQYTGAIGGGNEITFSPNSIGQLVTVRCHCGVEKNITDYKSW